MGHVTITLNSRTYRLRCGDGEEPRLLELANHLRHRIDRLSVEFGQVGDDRLLVMAALLATDELLDAKAMLAEAGRGGSAAIAQGNIPPPPLPPALQTDEVEIAASAAAPWDSPMAVNEKSGDGAISGAIERKGKPVVQRASLSDRLAEARDGSAPTSDRRTGSG